MFPLSFASSGANVTCIGPLYSLYLSPSLISNCSIFSTNNLYLAPTVVCTPSTIASKSVIFVNFLTKSGSASFPSNSSTSTLINEVSFNVIHFVPDASFETSKFDVIPFDNSSVVVPSAAAVISFRTVLSKYLSVTSKITVTVFSVRSISKAEYL